MNKINWNQLSELGLLEEINRKVLHKHGIAATRNPDNGASDFLIVADDRVFEYSQDIESTLKTDKEIQQALDLMVGESDGR